MLIHVANSSSTQTTIIISMQEAESLTCENALEIISLVHRSSYKSRMQDTQGRRAVIYTAGGNQGKFQVQINWDTDTGNYYNILSLGN